MSALLAFIKEVFKNPKAVGAVWPSSKLLANAIAARLADRPAGYVIELGAGTGAITKSLLKKMDPAQLIIVERSQKLAHLLEKRFPHSRILHGDAAELASLVADLDAPVTAVVSSLPFRSLNREVTHNILQQIAKVLAQDGLFIQFTYSLGSELTVMQSYFQRIDKHHVLINLPPARVDVFKTK